MPTPPPAAGALPGADAWQELEEVLAELGQLARSPISPEMFYDDALAATVRALSAEGGAIWLRSAGGALRPVAQLNWHGASIAAHDVARRGHEALLTHVADSGRVLSLPPRASRDGGAVVNPSDFPLLLAPVRIARDAADGDAQRVENGATTVAILEIIPRGDASPAAFRGFEQFLAAVCELAADYHAHRELARLRRDETYRDQLLRLGTLVHRPFDLEPTAYAVANEGRRVVGCDRLSVLVHTGRRCRLLATSGASRVERRGGTARQLEQLAELVRPTAEPACYADGQSDALPPIADALERHAEQSHARQIAVVPLALPGETADETADERPEFVLVAEQFDLRDGDLARERLIEVGRVSATALYTAREVDELPLRWLLRPLGVMKRLVITHLTRSMLVAATLAAVVAALVFVPADFTIDAPATLEPAVRQDVFAPRNGLVDELLVAHGADVAAGQPLMKLRDPELELDLRRVRGEMETVRRQLDAVRAAKTGREIRDASPTELYRLSASEREFAQRLENLERELELLAVQRQSLVVRSPIAGRVLTWDVANRLAARPVERGEVLVTVADLSADWQLELAVADDRIGHVLAAREAIGAGLPVEFRLRSEDQSHTGRIQTISTTADVVERDATAASPTVRVIVAFDKSQLPDAAQRELRPGVSATAHIDCGRRSLGYVWLHDVWDAAIGWLRF
jgi:multidrug efflux pump subunit AcrA (membrane-fusion protein)